MAKSYEIRIYSKEDYEMVSGWWEGHGWPPVPEVILPKLGVVVTAGGRGVAAAWLYMDNSVGVCMCEWIVTSPENAGRETIGGIRAALDFLESEAKENDYGVMMTTCKQPALARLLEKRGFEETDTDMIHLVKVLE